MNIILRELRANFKTLMIWSISIIVFLAMGMMEFAAFSTMGEEANKAMEVLPDFMQKIFGFATISLTDIRGYFSVYNVFFILLLGIHASMLGATIIAKEARDKTADFLMVKPITRQQMITSKIIAAFINLVILNVVLTVTSILFVAANNTGESVTCLIIYLMGTLLILQCVFFSIGLALSALTKSSKKASSIATAVLLVMYLLSIARQFSDKLDFIKYITPFAYFDASDILFDRGIEWIFMVISVVVVISGLIVTYNQYQRKDIL